MISEISFITTETEDTVRQRALAYYAECELLEGTKKWQKNYGYVKGRRQPNSPRLDRLPHGANYEYVKGKVDAVAFILPRKDVITDVTEKWIGLFLTGFETAIHHGQIQDAAEPCNNVERKSVRKHRIRMGVFLGLIALIVGGCVLMILLN
jgi:hypothetical protein